MLPFSRLAVTYARDAALPDDMRARWVTDEQLAAGGAVSLVEGDLFDPAACPGPYDAVVEHRTLQHYDPRRQDRAIAALKGRSAPAGVFLHRAHNELNVSAEVLRRHGFSVRLSPRNERGLDFATRASDGGGSVAWVQRTADGPMLRHLRELEAASVADRR